MPKGTCCCGSKTILQRRRKKPHEQNSESTEDVQKYIYWRACTRTYRSPVDCRLAMNRNLEPEENNPKKHDMNEQNEHETSMSSNINYDKLSLVLNNLSNS